MTFLPLLPALFYLAWQLANLANWRRAKTETVSVPPGETPTVALLIPYRNEAENLPGLLDDIKRLQHPGLEVIFVDDHSEDGGNEIVGTSTSLSGTAAAGAMEGFQERGPTIRSLSLADHLNGRRVTAHKKEALAYAIGQTDADVIVTTDADCRLPTGFIRSLADEFCRGGSAERSRSADVVLGPVLIDAGDSPSLLTAFQALDFASYQLYTAGCVAAGQPTLANGACFAFRRELFLEAGGYAGLDHLPSGDDVLLLHRFAQRDDVRFAWSAGEPVLTRPVPTWAGLWRQRIRWAGKAGEYVSPKLQYGQAVAFLTALGIVGGLLLWPVDARFAAGALVAWAIKTVIDFVLLRDVTRHYGQSKLLRWYPLVQLIYPFYLVVVGTGALLGVKAEWKGR